MTRSQWKRVLGDLARQFGRSLEYTGSGHWRLVKPGYRDLFTSSTPSDHRILQNVRAKLRRAERTTA
jgi:hypothetical protein